MIEADAGYAIGINLNNAAFSDIRYFTSFDRFGFVLQAGSFFSQETIAYHIFLGPMMNLIKTPKWRVPLALGIDIIGENSHYFGIGSLIAVQYAFTNRFYVGFNLGITYAFNNIYDEITGYRTNKTVGQDDGGNDIIITQTVPVMESKNHYGNRFYFKPSLVIGIQF
jgi:hypothetical protein